MLGYAAQKGVRTYVVDINFRLFGLLCYNIGHKFYCGRCYIFNSFTTWMEQKRKVIKWQEDGNEKATPN